MEKPQKDKKSKAHIRYKIDGKGVPGATTVIGLRAKPALIKWANNLGLKGIDSAKFTDDKADIGTLAHLMIMNHFAGKETDTSDYTLNQIDAAENSLLSFFAWEKGKSIVPILIEAPMTSTVGFGGTVDLYCTLDGKKTLVDFKTGSGIYAEHYYQISAYVHLLTHNGHEVESARILNIPRSEDEQFKEEVYNNFVDGWEWFSTMLKIYEIEKRRGKGENSM
jgi:hypothetical protein